MFLGWVETSKHIQQSSLQECALEGHRWRIHHCVSVIRHLHGAHLTALRVVAVVWWWVRVGRLGRMTAGLLLGAKRRRIVCAKVVGYLTPAGRSSSNDLWVWGGCKA